MASDAAATTGDLTQKPGVAGCWSAVGLCSPGTALAGARSVTVSPDGRSAYAASQGGSAVVGVRSRCGWHADPEARDGGVHLGDRGGPVRGRHGARRRPFGDGQPRRQQRLRRVRLDRRGGGVRSRRGRHVDAEGGRGGLFLGQRGGAVCRRHGARRRVRGDGQPRRQERLRRVQRERRGGGVRSRRRRHVDAEGRHARPASPTPGRGPAATARRSAAHSGWWSAPTARAPTSRPSTAARWRCSIAPRTAR